MTDDPKMTRREFLRDGGRWAVALIIGGGAAYLATRDTDGETCINDSRCRGCGRIDGCHLPAAVSTRAAMKQERANG